MRGAQRKTVEEEEAEAEAKRLAAEEEAAKAKADAEAQAPATIGVTVDSTREQINEYASKLTPPVDTTKAANKPDAIKLIEEALAAQTPAAE